jgi:hypothetical protein
LHSPFYGGASCLCLPFCSSALGGSSYVHLSSHSSILTLYLCMTLSCALDINASGLMVAAFLALPGCIPGAGNTVVFWSWL